MEPKKQVGRLTQAQRHFFAQWRLIDPAIAQRERDKEKRKAPVSRGLSGGAERKAAGRRPTEAARRIFAQA